MPPINNRITPENIAENYQRDFVPAIAIPVSQALFRIADLRQGERVLDIACGTGQAARAAAEKVGSAGSVAGVDIAPNMVAVAKTAAPDIDWHIANAEHLPFSDAVFDAILCQMGLMFVEDRSAALAEMYRVLVSGGRAIITTPGRIQPVFENLEQAVAENVGPDLGKFVRAVFSMNEPEMLAGPLREGGFGNVSANEESVLLRLPKPAEFLWQYVNMTPMAPFAAQASEDARSAAEDQFVKSCEPYVADGQLVFEQPIVTASGTKMSV